MENKMAKKAKVVKKRKPKDWNEELNKLTGMKGSDFQSNQTTSDENSYQPPPRALESAIIFVDGQRLLVRHLTDQRLLEQSAQLSVTMYKVRRELEGLENLYLNMNREKNFRNL